MNKHIINELINEMLEELSMDKAKLDLSNYEIMYPITYPTVDVAVVDFENEKVLLGKKKGRKHYCFVGGFVDPTDLSLEHACARELDEEVRNLTVSDNYYYVSSHKINDKRYPLRDETITTTFFTTDYMKGNPMPKKHNGVTEFEDVQFFDINKKSLGHVSGNHKALFRDLIEWMEV